MAFTSTSPTHHSPNKRSSRPEELLITAFLATEFTYSIRLVHLQFLPEVALNFSWLPEVAEAAPERTLVAAVAEAFKFLRVTN
jgi:hypothetical protein